MLTLPFQDGEALHTPLKPTRGIYRREKLLSLAADDKNFRATEEFIRQTHGGWKSRTSPVAFVLPPGRATLARLWLRPKAW